MSKAALIVSDLLEDNESQDDSIVPPESDVDPEAFLDAWTKEKEAERAEGTLNVYNADDYHYFYHRTRTYSDGITPLMVRRNGKTKRWARRPTEFAIPIKVGFRGYGYITQRDADEWSTVALPQKPKPPKEKKPRKPRVKAPPPEPEPPETLSPLMYKDELERQEREKQIRVPRPPNHPELPL